MTRFLYLIPLALAIGCDAFAPPPEFKSLSDARKGFVTQIVTTGENAGPPEIPPSKVLELVTYDAQPGQLAAYITPDPQDGTRHPAIIWITGGDCNSIGDVWTASDPSNDQTAKAFRDAGVVTMYPSLRGGNNNPGQREGFFGEVDDVLDAAKYLATRSYVDRNQIYLGGHSTGGTLVLLVAASENPFQAIFSLGPVGVADQYGGQFIYCNPNDDTEVGLRSPMFFLHCIQKPTYVFEGSRGGNWPVIELMKQWKLNPNVQFFKLSNHDHFSCVAPLNSMLARQIAAGEIAINASTVSGL